MHIMVIKINNHTNIIFVCIIGQGKWKYVREKSGNFDILCEVHEFPLFANHIISYRVLSRFQCNNFIVCAKFLQLCVCSVPRFGLQC